MFQQSIFHTYKRFRTIRSHQIMALPLVILMPHSACNCRCVMCDIWKGNKNLKQLSRDDIAGLLATLKKLGTQQILMTGGEALLNPHFFEYCSLLRSEGISVCLLSTGLSIGQHAESIVEHIDQLIISIDGPKRIHDSIRNVPGAFEKLSKGVEKIRTLKSSFPIAGRSVIHKLNFRHWPELIDAAIELGLDHISFLPADVSSHAFNRPDIWELDRQSEIMLSETDVEELEYILEFLFNEYAPYFKNGFISESPEKLLKIHTYYAALLGNNVFPFKKCNAPWVSVVVEADGTVRPCFFHDPIGNIHTDPLENIINNQKALQFRRELDINTNEICAKCVCYLHLSPSISIK